MTSGPVKLTVKRDGENVVDFATEEWITYAPNRTDMVTYTFSNKFKEYYKYIFERYFDGVHYYTARLYNEDYNKK